MKDVGEIIKEFNDIAGFEKELKDLINKHSMEKYSDTPDWILAKYLVHSLMNFDAMINFRTEWYGEKSNDT